MSEHGKEPLRVLFLCTGNSARSIIAEAILNKDGRGRFVGYSAGSHPKGALHPQTPKLLDGLRHPIEALRSKSWDEFAIEAAPEFDFIITVCDDAAGEVCPIWPGHPITSHWGLPDPAAAAGSEAEVALAFADTYRMLSQRIGLFTSIPFERLSRLSLKHRIDEIGQRAEATEPTA